LKNKESAARCVSALSESDLTLAPDRTTRSTKALTTLLANKECRTERLVQVRFNEYPVSTDAAAKPSREGFPVGQRGRVHRPKFRRKQFGVAASNSEHNERSGVSDHCGANHARQLRCISPHKVHTEQ
jgi:hypothetical protein